jgi:ComF family protein
VEGLEQIAATGRHMGKLQQAVQALKYDGAVKLRMPLGQRLAKALDHLHWPVDAVAAVPMHPTRLAERGYNQAFLLAQALSEISEIACLDGALQRTRATRSQVGLNQEERRHNLADAFSAHPDAVRGKSLLIVDDVCTTGATLAGSAQAALNAGAIAVYALTVTEA